MNNEKMEMTPDTYQQLVNESIPEGISPLDLGRFGTLGLISCYTAFKGTSDLLEGVYTKSILAAKPEERKRVESQHMEVLGELWRFFAELCTANGLKLSETIPEKEYIHWTFTETAGQLARLYQKSYIEDAVDHDQIKDLLLEMGSYLKWATEWQWLYDMSEIWEANIKGFQGN